MQYAFHHKFSRILLQMCKNAYILLINSFLHSLQLQFLFVIKLQMCKIARFIVIFLRKVFTKGSKMPQKAATRLATAVITFRNKERKVRSPS